jgi:hypothetical protein
MKSLYTLSLLVLLFTSCSRQKLIDECSDKTVYVTNQGELHTLTARSGAPVPEDWAMRVRLVNEGRVEVHQIVIRKGEKHGYTEFQSSDKVTKISLEYCGHLDN